MTTPSAPYSEPLDADFARYLRRLGASLGTLLAAALALVVVTDPYGLYGIPTIAGFNAIKPYPQRHLNEIKLAHAERRGAELIIVGNSRAEIGFDPRVAARRKPDGNPEIAASLAIPGSGLSTTRSQLEYLERQGHAPRRIILGLEFLDFISANRSRNATPSVPREHPVERILWRFDSLFSLTSLRDAVRTPLLQRTADPESLTAEGFNPLLEYEPLARHDGYAKLFRQRAQENARVFVRLAHGVADEDAWSDFAALLELAARNHTELAIVIYPYHAQILAMFESAGLWPAFDAWKTRAALSIAQVGIHQPQARIALYDFSGFGEQACERIPLPSDLKSTTRWYWEGGHFKKSLGDLVLQRLTDDTLPRNPADHGTAAFGMRLDASAATLDANRARIAEERQRCQDGYPELFSDAARQIADARRPTP